MSKIDCDVRDKMARGLILDLLIETGMRPQSLYILLKMMEAQAFPLGEQNGRPLKTLDLHLTYLIERGYVRRTAKLGRANLDGQTVRALAKAVRLRDGEIPADPGILFFDRQGDTG